MKFINRISVLLVIILIIITPVIIFILSNSTNKQIEENAVKAQNYAKISAEKKLQLEKDYTLISNEIPGIVCIGSDLMSSSGTLNTKLATELNTKLVNEGYRIPITNLAIPGENILTILGRIGVIPFVTGETVNIPAESTLVNIKIESSEEGFIWPLAVNADNYSFNPVTINDKTGIIGGSSEKDPQTGENNHYFIRSEDGLPYTIPKGSIIKTSSDDEFKDYVHIIWLGENDTIKDYDKLANYIQQIIDSCGKNKNRYLVMGLIDGDDESSKEYDDIMSENFGSHYLNVRKYLSDYDLRKTDIIFTDRDKEQQQKGIVPHCFLQDSGNLNDTAYKALTEYIYNSLIANDCIRKPVE